MKKTGDWFLALLINIFFLILFLLLPIDKYYSVEKPQETVVEIVNIEEYLQRKNLSSLSTPIEMTALQKQPPVSPDISKTHSLSYEPEESSDNIVDPLSWEPSENDISIIMPEDPLLESFPEENWLQEDLFSEEETYNDQVILNWSDGLSREILYMPLWNPLFDRELKQNLIDITLMFQISEEGYIINIEVDKDVSINEAWQDLLVNWTSQVVFEPGKQGQGEITLIFEERIQ